MALLAGMGCHFIWNESQWIDGRQLLVISVSTIKVYVLTVENHTIIHTMWFVGMCLTKDNAVQCRLPLFSIIFWIVLEPCGLNFLQ